MTRDPVDAIARTLLYEGYLLYPYRPSAIKNQQRFNFGVLSPRDCGDVRGAAASWQLQTQVPIQTTSSNATIDVTLRCLQLVTRHAEGRDLDTWHEAAERDVCLPTLALTAVLEQRLTTSFELPGGVETTPADATGPGIVRTRQPIHGQLDMHAEAVGHDVVTLTVAASNLTPVPDSALWDRDDTMVRSLISTHIVLHASGAELISLLDPPEVLRDTAAACKNVGVWPVLVGEQGSRDRMLASPIILYDYPEIAPESDGDLFDGTEIDEILALRILTMTDEEKREVRDSDDQARQILERTEAFGEDHWRKLHGAVRGLRRGTEGGP